MTPYQSAARNSELTFVAQAMQVSSTSSARVLTIPEYVHTKLIMLHNQLMVRALSTRAGGFFVVSTAALDQAHDI